MPDPETPDTDELPDDTAEGQEVVEDEFTEVVDAPPSDDELPEPESPESDDDTPDMEGEGL